MPTEANRRMPPHRNPTAAAQIAAKRGTAVQRDGGDPLRTGPGPCHPDRCLADRRNPPAGEEARGNQTGALPTRAPHCSPAAA